MLNRRYTQMQDTHTLIRNQKRIASALEIPYENY